MIVVIDKREAAALTFHMNIMRPSFRNILKKKYRNELKEYIASYDYIKSEATNATELEKVSHELHMNIKDLEILQAFLQAYLYKAQQVNDEAKSDDFQEHLNALTSVKLKSDECLSA